MLRTDATPAHAEVWEEAELVRLLAAFDPDAWQRLFNSHYDRILGLALVRTRDRGAAEDIAAEVFAEAVRGIGRYRYRGIPLRTWLYRIARNLIADQLKARRRRNQVSLESLPNELIIRSENFEMKAEFMRALESVTPPQQEVLILRFVEQYCLKEVAMLTGRTLNAVKQMQHRGVLTIREYLGA